MKSTFATALRHTLFPSQCLVCEKHLADAERFVCSSCLASLPITNFHHGGENPMTERLVGRLRFAAATGFYYYRRGAPVAKLVQQFKYGGKPGLARVLGAHIATRLLPTGFFADTEIIIPMPTHFSRIMARGYNQVHYLARGISDATGLPVEKTLLKSVRSHSTQTRLTADQRRANLRGIFKVPHPERLDGRKVLLVDDICTTGTTISEAAETLLRAAPTITLRILTLAVTP